MKTEHHSNAETPGGDQEQPAKHGFIKELGRDVGKDLLRETGTTMKWTLGGALVGAVALGGIGFWKFGIAGLAIGAVAGAAVGGGIGFWLYFSA